MKCHGYTLFELMLVLSIVSLLSLMAIVSFQYGYYHLKTLVVTRQISNELYLARSEAIAKQQRTVYGSDGSWDKRRIIKQNDKLLHVLPSLPEHYHLTLRNSLHKNENITFAPLGFTTSERGSFYLETPYETIRIVILLSGKIQIEQALN